MNTRIPYVIFSFIGAIVVVSCRDYLFKMDAWQTEILALPAFSLMFAVFAASRIFRKEIVPMTATLFTICYFTMGIIGPASIALVGIAMLMLIVELHTDCPPTLTN